MKLRAVKNEILDSPCTSIYVKLFLKNKYWKYVEIYKNYSILVLYNMFN